VRPRQDEVKLAPHLPPAWGLSARAAAEF